MKPKILLVSNPPTPLDLVAYHLGKRFDVFAAPVLVKRCLSKFVEPSDIAAETGVTTARVITKVLRESSISVSERYLLSWGETLHAAKRVGINKYLAATGLEEAETWLVRALDADPVIWPLKIETLSRMVPNLTVAEPASKVRSRSYRFISLPVLKRERSESGELDREEVIDITAKKLLESRVKILADRTVVLAIGGPPNSGKSTFAVSLAHEMTLILEGLASRGRHWKHLPKVFLETSDKGTPVTHDIMSGRGKDRELVTSRKVPWSDALAYEVIDRLYEIRRKPGIVITDLPGGQMRWLAACADFGFVVTNDWSKVREWTQLFHSYGMPCLGAVRSRPPVDRLPSVLSLHNPGKFLSGRVVDLDRVNRSWDRFISNAAEFLLFDILPAQIEKGLRVIS